MEILQIKSLNVTRLFAIINVLHGLVNIHLVVVVASFFSVNLNLNTEDREELALEGSSITFAPGLSFEDRVYL